MTTKRQRPALPITQSGPEPSGTSPRLAGSTCPGSTSSTTERALARDRPYPGIESYSTERDMTFNLPDVKALILPSMQQVLNTLLCEFIGII